MNETEIRIQQELAAVIGVLTEMTGLASRWSGEVELSQDARTLGRKPFTCHIVINESLVNQPTRWRTLIHEALHSLSAGYNREDYQVLRGWEEGVVEKLQRLYRSSVLARLSLTIDSKIFQAIEEDYPFNKYIEALEQLRLFQQTQFVEKFYLDLLATEIKLRPGLILGRGLQLPRSQHTAFIKLFSRTNSTLKEFL